MSGCTKCPVTMCPYLGNEESGSPWTGGKNTVCEPSCGWWQGGSCLGGKELAWELADEYGVEPLSIWPACPKEDACQWQRQQPSHIPCPPRIKVMANEELSESFL